MLTKLDIKINNITLTPLTCATIISEVIKCLIYQKSQIPYSYNWLQHYVTNKQKENEIKNLLKEKKHRIASEAYRNIEEMTTNLNYLFVYQKHIKEVMVLFGATPLNPKEVYRFQIPTLASGHLEKNHSDSRMKNQHHVLRSIMFSNEWTLAMDRQLMITNMYLFVKLKNSEKVFDNNLLEYFTQNPSFSTPSRPYTTCFNFLYEDLMENCCNNLVVYGDKESQCEQTGENDEQLESEQWFQANFILKGFKDSQV